MIHFQNSFGDVIHCEERPQDHATAEFGTQSIFFCEEHRKSGCTCFQRSIGADFGQRRKNKQIVLRKDLLNPLSMDGRDNGNPALEKKRARESGKRLSFQAFTDHRQCHMGNFRNRMQQSIEIFKLHEAPEVQKTERIMLFVRAPPLSLRLPRRRWGRGLGGGGLVGKSIFDHRMLRKRAVRKFVEFLLKSCGEKDVIECFEKSLHRKTQSRMLGHK